MTFRAKPVVKRAHRPSWEQNDRRNLFLNIAFGLVVLAAILILVAAAGASYYDEHFSSVATVNGTSINKDQLSERAAVDTFRVDYLEASIRTQVNSGRLSQAQAEQQLSQLESERQGIPQSSLEKLIDAALQGELAAQEGIAISDAQIDERITTEATRPEQRHAWEIAVTPEVSPDATEPTAEQDAAARKKIDQALADLTSGKAWEDVAKSVSTSSSSAQGGDLGWLIKESSYEQTFVDALFAAEVDTPTAVLEGEDGTYRIGRVTEISLAERDPDYEQKITDAGIPITAYQAAVRADLTRSALNDKITAGLTETATPQRDVSQIVVQSSGGGSTGEEVKSSHILYSPKDDPSGAQAIAPDDPAWKAAEDEANAAYKQLQEDATQFAEIAKAESDDTGSGAEGGDLPWFQQGDVDPAFGTALFQAGLTPGQILPPVKSQFGWHIIRYEDRRADAATRAQQAHEKAIAPNADFAALAKELSDGPEAADGGALGWIARYQVDPEQEDAIFATPVGSVSDVLQTASGYNIFKVLREETRKPEGEQLATLEDNAFTNWYAAMKAAATIERIDQPTVE
jgi:parvulin-like peptidyl-prolyl isomerase